MLIKLTDAVYVAPSLVTSVTAQLTPGDTWRVGVMCAGGVIIVEEVATYETATAGVAAIVEALKQGGGGTP